MFNNRHPDQTVASIRMTIDLIRAKHLRHPLQKLSMAFRSVQVPDLYYVEPARTSVKRRSGCRRAGFVPSEPTSTPTASRSN